MSHELEPRVSVLEKGQEALQRDLSQLTTAVRDQGTQLTMAIAKLADNTNANFTQLAEKLSSSQKTDWHMFWQTLFTGVGIVVVLLGACFAPVWMSITYHHETIHEIKASVAEIQKTTNQNAIDIAVLRDGNTNKN